MCASKITYGESDEQDETTQEGRVSGISPGNQRTLRKLKTRLRIIYWSAAPGVVVGVEEVLPDSAVIGLGLRVVGSMPDGTPTGYMKMIHTNKPNSVVVPDASYEPHRLGPAARDGTVMPEGTEWEDRFEGVRSIVARQCGLVNRRGPKRSEYYGEKYAAFVQYAEREMDAKQRAAVMANAEKIERPNPSCPLPGTGKKKHAHD